MQPTSEMGGMFGKTGWRVWPPVMAREGCASCHGTGWELLPGSGSARARRCACRTEAANARLNEHLGIPRRYESCTFDSFTPLNLSQVRAQAEASWFAEKFPDVDRGLFFVGKAGVGKTHLAVAVVRELLRKFHEDVIFADFPMLLPGASRVEWGRLRSVSLLVLDNFGLASPAPERLCAAAEVLRSRLDAGGLTILTGENLKARQLPGGLVFSLLRRTKVLSMLGQDYRMLSVHTV